MKMGQRSCFSLDADSVESTYMSSSKIFPRPEIISVSSKILNVSLSREKFSSPSVSDSWNMKRRDKTVEDSEVSYTDTGLERPNQQGKRRISSLSSRKNFRYVLKF